MGMDDPPVYGALVRVRGNSRCVWEEDVVCLARGTRHGEEVKRCLGFFWRWMELGLARLLEAWALL